LGGCGYVDNENNSENYNLVWEELKIMSDIPKITACFVNAKLCVLMQHRKP
jgi:hypothetical protein